MTFRHILLLVLSLHTTGRAEVKLPDVKGVNRRRARPRQKRRHAGRPVIVLRHFAWLGGMSASVATEAR